MAGLKKLFATGVDRGIEEAQRAAGEPMDTVSSTVRFGGDLRRFLEAQAAAQGGLSVQAVITAILNGVMHETMNQNVSAQISMVPRRLLELFQHHQIDLITAAEILGIPFGEMEPDRLVMHIDNSLIDRVCGTFFVSRDALLGKLPIGCRPEFRWDRSPVHAAERILERAREGLEPRVVFLKKKSWDLDAGRRSGGNGQRIPIVLELTHKSPQGRVYKTYEVLEGLPWEYERCRLDLLTLVLFCQRMYARNHWGVAEKLGLPGDFFLPSHAAFSWSDLNLDDQFFDRFRNGDITAREAVSQATYTFGIEDFIEDPKNYSKAKSDPRELDAVVKQYDKLMDQLVSRLREGCKKADSAETIQRG